MQNHTPRYALSFLSTRKNACVDWLSSSNYSVRLIHKRDPVFFSCRFISHTFPFVLSTIATSSQNMTDPRSCTYEFHYFPIHALGATSRAILSISGVEWVDKVQPFEVKSVEPSWQPSSLPPALSSLFFDCLFLLAHLN